MHQHEAKPLRSPSAKLLTVFSSVLPVFGLQEALLAALHKHSGLEANGLVLCSIAECMACPWGRKPEVKDASLLPVTAARTRRFRPTWRRRGLFTKNATPDATMFLLRSASLLSAWE